MKLIQYSPGMMITEPGIYSGIPIEVYHNDPKLFDGPSVSKSALKWILPTHGGSPKAFWGRWKFNKDHITQKSTPTFDFGKAAHCLLLGDEVFGEKFVIRPGTYPGKADKPVNWNNNATFCRDWNDEQAAAGLTIITTEQVEIIRRMSKDAAQNPIVRSGLLNGSIEHSICYKDTASGIWLKVRPDSGHCADGIYGDLKTTSSLDEDFLARQLHDACYYLQGASIRMVCRHLEMPFDSFVLLYVLNDDVPDTAHVEVSDEDLALGEREIRWALDAIRACLDAGDWPGARPYADGTRPIGIKPWARQKISEFLEYAEHTEQAA